MKYNKECSNCILLQLSKVKEILDLSDNEVEKIKREINNYISTEDLTQTPPYIYGKAWSLISNMVDNKDIYKNIRDKYNEEIYHLVPEIKNLINNSLNPLRKSLEIAIVGNLLDLANKTEFSMTKLKKMIESIEETPFGIDDSPTLFEKLKETKTLLYLGDNCGEIVFDKLFIDQIKKSYPAMKIFFAVRGKSAVNDVLLSDANQIKMEEVATVISNGDGSLGTELKYTSNEFQKIFQEADLIISKGQGNFESLSEKKDDRYFYLFLIKCKIIAQYLNIKEFSIICKNN